VADLFISQGWSGPKEFHGELIEGSFHSHQVPLPNAKTDKEELQALQHWLSSYNPHELFHIKHNSSDHKEDGHPIEDILSVIPETQEKKLGQRKEAYAAFEALRVPEWIDKGVDRGSQVSCMKLVGSFLKEIVKEYVGFLSLFCSSNTHFPHSRFRNPKSFRIFSPDELVSNKLDAVLDESDRNFQWDVASRAKGGRVIEILSEHTCQGMLQGYTLTGRTGLFPSYEAFLGIIQTMMVQYSKFVKMVFGIAYVSTSNH
jgi:xylulose-5-phosphate/fructose-6-phosphate phosphoketolase